MQHGMAAAGVGAEVWRWIEGRCRDEAAAQLALLWCGNAKGINGDVLECVVALDWDRLASIVLY